MARQVQPSCCSSRSPIHAAACVLQLTAAGPSPVTNPGAVGVLHSQHVSCRCRVAAPTARRVLQLTADVLQLTAASPRSSTNLGAMGCSISSACATAVVLPLRQHMCCSSLQPIPVPLPIEGLWGLWLCRCSHARHGASSWCALHGARRSVVVYPPQVLVAPRDLGGPCVEDVLQSWDELAQR